MPWPTNWLGITKRHLRTVAELQTRLTLSFIATPHTSIKLAFIDDTRKYVHQNGEVQSTTVGCQAVATRGCGPAGQEVSTAHRSGHPPRRGYRTSRERSVPRCASATRS